MQLGETNPQLRRILLTILVADGSALASDVDTLSPTLLVAKNSATLIAATGTLAHTTGEDHLHYYEASAAEATIPGFLLVVVIQAGIQTAIGWAPVGQIFALGETDPGKLRLPLTLYDTSEPPALATGAALGGASDLQRGLNGGAFANDGGSLVEIGHGAYYWQAPAAAAAAQGFVTVRVAISGLGLCLVWTSVDVLASVSAEVTPPALLAPIAAALTEVQGIVTLDLVAIALSRLPHQYRGTNG